MKLLTSITLAFISLTTISQTDFTGGFIGVNGGAYFANKNTAMMYSGGNQFSVYGIEWAFQNQYYKPDLDNYFQYPYEIAELPEGMTYRPSLDIGLIMGYNMDNSAAVFLEANIAQLKIQDVFVVEINNPNNTSPSAQYEQIPIFGEEQRLNINAGFRFGVFEKNGLNGFVPIYGNINAVQLKRNYFVINNRQYPIVHNIQGYTNERPGGAGYGAGTGFGMRYGINDNIILEANYNIMYSKITMLKSAGFQEWGLQHGIGIRVIWG